MRNVINSYILYQVPKYLAERWENAEGNSEVGKLRLTRSK